jgi:hypothetical protein
MKERPKLGRGLQDVSRFFLTGAPQPEPYQAQALSPHSGKSSIGVCCPSSELIQASFVANIALELARHRFPVVIRDFSVTEEARLSTLMHAVLCQDERTTDKAFVKLYGLPEIVLQDNGRQGLTEERETPGPDARPVVDEDSAGFILVNPSGSLDFIQEEKPCDEYVVITRTDERSLLQCYAYIKVIHERSFSSKVHIVFDDAEAGSDNDAVFKKLSRFIHDHLEFTADFLGSLPRDEHFEGSITNQRPLVLFQGASVTKDALTRICSRLLEGYCGQEERI